jgi:putative FmdB family regulatory protein
MPTYEYECSKCSYAFEAFQNITAQPLDKCPKCGGKVKRLISSGAGIIFKGSGFYATDYRKKSKSQKVADSPGTVAKKSECSSCPQAKEGCQMKPEP